MSSVPPVSADIRPVRALPPPGPGVLAIALLVASGLWLPAALDPHGRWANLLDNAHWTFSYSVAALLVWTSLRRCGDEDREARLGIAISLSCMAAGQWVWNLQVYAGWNPFPAPSDAIWVLQGVAAVATFTRLIRHLPRANRRLAALDVGGFALAGLALVLTLYLPSSAGSTPLQMAVLAAYPVLLLSASAAALVAQMYLRLRLTFRWIVLFIGLVGLALAWMIWNVRALQGTTSAGALLNLVFSVAALLLGWGAAGWHLQNSRSEKFDRFCEGCTRQLPLAMVAMTSAAMAMLALQDQLPQLVRGALLLLAVLALLSAPVRQSLQLSERDRLIETERRLAESRARLEYLAHHDALTGLANLARLRERANQAIAAADDAGRGVGVALMFIDLDRFKEVNDTLGHGAGDALLQHAGRELARLVRSADTVCRQGGDEFAIVLPDIGNIAEVVRVADQIMRLGAGTVSVDGHELPLSMSIGVALYPHDAHGFETLLQCADIAMYNAKAAGRNVYRFYDVLMSVEATERMQMRGRLAHALERGELQIHYQPIVDLPDGRIIGAEALLRWQQPELGQVEPASFIPVAEDSGLIVPIGTWVLREACRQAAAWHAAGMDQLIITVNLSVLQFRRSDLQATVMQALRESGLPPHCLELEVTESVLMEDRDMVTPTLERLRQSGVRVSIDDFGTGYCNLGYLKSVPAAKLKMDQSLIRDMTDNTRDAGVAKAVVQIAHELGLAVVAEGVETAAQRQMLQGFGCDHAQGYLFSRPLSAVQFGDLCRGELPAQAQSA
jgi:diguanylate cyclase (GGDEF)-like protein